MHRRGVGSVAALVAMVGMAVVLVAPSAWAGLAPPSLHAFCSDEDHSGAPYDDPNGGPSLTDPLSVIPFGGSLDGLPSMDDLSDPMFRLDASGPSGEELSYEGPIVEANLFQGILGINQGGDYQVTAFTASGTTADGPTSFELDPADFPDGGVMSVTFDTEAPCDATTVEPGTPAASSPTESTASTIESTEPTSTEAPSTAPPSTDVEIAVGDTPGESTFRQLFIVPIVLGGLLIVVGVWVYSRTRERETAPPVSSTPPPPVPTPDRCDWAAYYDNGTRRVPLRTATGHECCVYVVSMTSAIVDAQVTAKGRQAPDVLDGVDDAVDGRLRVFDHGFEFRGLDLWSWASARSGPAGRLDWMQAGPSANWPNTDGAPPTVPEDYRPQFRAHEEAPDAAISVRYDEVNRLRIVLEAGCPAHEHRYDASGDGIGDLQLNAQCDNTEASPECPVEIDALTYSQSAVVGDLAYALDIQTPGTPDEVEGTSGLDVREVDGVTFTGSHVDTHDHDTQATQTVEGSTAGNAPTTTTRADTFEMKVDNLAIHDAAVTVPARVFDTTDAVTADVYTDFRHDITVDAAMTRTTCAPPGSPCCGHTECACAPALQVSFTKGGDAWIDCDGTRHPINRNNFGTMFGLALGAEANWEIG